MPDLASTDVLTVAAVIVVLPIAYYVATVAHSYINSRAFSVTVSWSHEHLKIGETITATFSFFKVIDEAGRLREVPITHEELKSLNPKILPSVTWMDGPWKPVSVVRSIHPPNQLALRFSLRRCGSWQLSLKHNGYFHFLNSPFLFHLGPGLHSEKRTRFGSSNLDLLRVILDGNSYILMKCFDRYGNLTDRVPSEFVAQFGVVLDQRGRNEEVPFEHEFLPEPDQNAQAHLYLRIKANRVGIFRCFLTFNQERLFPFTLVCLSSEEESLYQKRINGSWLFFRRTGEDAEVVRVGQNQISKKVWVQISLDTVTLSFCKFFLVYRPFLCFYCARTTKMELEKKGGENGLVRLRLADGVQDTVTLSLPESNARVMLVMFAFMKARKVVHRTYEEKVKYLRSTLKNYWFQFAPYYLLLEDGDAIGSSMRKCPTSRTDWLRNFIVGFIIPQPNNPCNIPSTSFVARWTRDIKCWFWRTFSSRYPPSRPVDFRWWLVDACLGPLVQKHFTRYGGSRRLHPQLPAVRADGIPGSDAEMEFVGSLVAKSVWDSVHYATCFNMRKFLFSKSLLSCLIGNPPQCQMLRTDYPELWATFVKPLLEGNLRGMENLTFQTPPGFEIGFLSGHDGEPINLVPGGGTVKVTPERRSDYLNLLSWYVLKRRHKAEIGLFRTGFYKVIPQDKISDFEIDEVESLIAGGGSSFSILDMKANYKVIAELTPSDTTLRSPELFPNIEELEKKELLSWFWCVVANLSPEEEGRLLHLATGTNSLPSCGFRDLVPKFTISLTGDTNGGPSFQPGANTVCIGKHASFELFERKFLQSLWKDEDEDIVNSP